MGVCHYRAQPRYPVEASIRTENHAPPDAGSGRAPPQQSRNPRRTPDAPAAGCQVFCTKLQQPGRRNPSVQEASGMIGMITINSTSAGTHRRSSSPMEKSPVGFYAGEPDPSKTQHQASQARRPSTSESPYQLGRNEPGCDGTTAAKQPPPRRKFTDVMGIRGRLRHMLLFLNAPKKKANGWVGGSLPLSSPTTIPG